jgi:hypothetical protein
MEQSVFDEVVADEGAGFCGVPRFCRKSHMCRQGSGALGDPDSACSTWPHFRSLDKTEPEQRGLG